MVCQHAAHEGRHGRDPGGSTRPEPTGLHECQRLPMQQGLGIGADAPHQGQGFPVGADQDVLTVVKGLAVALDAARTAACAGGHLEQRHGAAELDETHGRRQAGPAGADHCDAGARAALTARAHCPRQWVRVAIHSLRSGVSDVRWCSTWKPWRSISRSSVR
jgi:hypothetical protein